MIAVAFGLNKGETGVFPVKRVVSNKQMQITFCPMVTGLILLRNIFMVRFYLSAYFGLEQIQQVAKLL